MTAKWYGVNFPFYKGNTLLGVTSKVAPRQEDARLLKNDLLQGILTSNGERLFRPQFGGNIYNTLWEMNDVVARNELERSISEHIIRFHPAIRLKSVNISDDLVNPNMMKVTVLGSTNLTATTPEEVIVEFQVPKSGSI